MGQANKQFLRQLSVLALVNLIALAGWLVFLVKISGISTSISETVEAKAVEEAKEEGGRVLAHQASETRVSREKLENFFLRDQKETITQFLEGLESLGRQAQLNLEIISVARAEDNLRLTFKTTGSFGSTYYLIKLIEAVPMKVHLESSRLETKVAEVSGPVSWNGLFVLDLESFLPPESNEKK